MGYVMEEGIINIIMLSLAFIALTIIMVLGSIIVDKLMKLLDKMGL